MMDSLLCPHSVMIVHPAAILFSEPVWRGVSGGGPGRSGWRPKACSISFTLLGPEPAFGRLGLGGSLGGYSSHGYTSHASLRAYGAQLGGDRLVFKRPTKDGEELLLG